ncbi:N-6 DNA methylase [Streptomyces sp. NPDC048696]|uniref:N-6 DNA methylase n=1 Tax=Streptomyces sp. NPDC048696 TaxID=3365585 RepID=UPI00371FEEB7
MAIAEAVTKVWHTGHGGNHSEVPLGLVAALALIRQKDSDGPDLRTQILHQSPADLVQMYREIWSAHWLQRPDLIDRARILHEWLNDDEVDEHRSHLVREVTKAALNGGLFELTGHHDPFVRSQTDVLSPVMMLLRSHGARQGLGEYHTPDPVAEAMSHVVVVAAVEDQFKTLKGGEHIHDPAAGSGGLLRAAAQRIREFGINPANHQWSMVDIDEMAAACAAVNAIVWGLGYRVTVACDDSLANPNAVEDAMRHAREVIKHRDRMWEVAHMASAVGRAHQLMGFATKAAA